MLVISVLKRLNVHFIPLSSIITKYRSGTLVMFGSVNNWLKEHRGYLQVPTKFVGGWNISRDWICQLFVSETSLSSAVAYYKRF